MTEAAPVASPVGVEARRSLELADRIQAHWHERDDTSHDPYDGLLARRVPTRFKATRAGRLALVHLHRRFPRNLRPVFGVPPTKSAYTVALFASASLRIARMTGSSAARDAARRRLAWLRASSIRGGWAYPFDVQTRTFHYARTTPNIVCTAFAARAFLDAAQMAGDEQALGVAGDAARFAVRELLVHRGGRSWFRYLSTEDELIHNANALGAELVVRYGTLAGDRRLVDLGLEALPATTGAVGDDGSLRYGRERHLAWVDGHHTGFVIESLDAVARCHPDFDGTVRETIEAMARFYRKRLFRSDGWPYQRPDRPYPLDSIAAAQGIQTFATLGGAHRSMAERIADCVIATLLLPSGRFAYARGRCHLKRVPYARWTEAPLCLAFAVLASEAEGVR
ncbi:MAG: hypothetical protein M3144_07195 [Actinomycetota bacterium]|nr:hypothetical protein [Actinomycetota bacterium]